MLETLSFPFQTPTALKEDPAQCPSGSQVDPAEGRFCVDQARLTGQQSQSAYLEGLYQMWSEREAFGEKFIKALEAYIDGFFAEEEQRILPVLKNGLSHAQMRAGSQPLPSFAGRTENGVRIEKIDTTKNRPGAFPFGAHLTCFSRN